MPQNDIRWKTNHRIRLRDWPESAESTGNEPGAAILYIPATGDLHLVTRPAGRVLQLLDEGATSAADIYQRVSHGFDGHVPGMDSEEEFIATYLYPFEDLGIIEQSL